DRIAADDRAAKFSMLALATGPATGSFDPNVTTIIDYTGQQKSNQLLYLQHQFHVADKNVLVQPDPNRKVDYVVILGEDYFNLLNKCLVLDQETKNITPTPAP